MTVTRRWSRGWRLIGLSLAACLLTVPAVAERPVGRCSDRGAVRWLGARPHTPLAISNARGVRSAGVACCDEWSRKGIRWRALDAFGQVVGQATVASRERYDVTGCYEATLARTEGSEGAGLYVAGPWNASASAAWTPTAEERVSFDRFAAEVAHIIHSGIAPTAVPPAGAIFFQARAESGAVAKRFAVVGGRALFIARFDGPSGDGRQASWRLAWIDEDSLGVQSGAAAPRTFQPIAVVDMDGDGIPEVIAHVDLGDSWSDIVIRMQAGEGIWRKAAESVHGATA